MVFMTFCFKLTIRRREPYFTIRKPSFQAGAWCNVEDYLYSDTRRWNDTSEMSIRMSGALRLTLRNLHLALTTSSVRPPCCSTVETTDGPSRVNILGPRLVALCRCPNNHKPIRRGNPLRRRDKQRYVCDYLAQEQQCVLVLWLAYLVLFSLGSDCLLCVVLGVFKTKCYDRAINYVYSWLQK